MLEVAVLAITAAIVLWYTFETRRIRVEAQNQNSALAEQNRMLAEQNGLLERQLSMVQDEKDRERLKEEAAAQPYFRIAGGSMYHATGGTFNLTNLGGPMRRLRVEPLNGAELKKSEWPFVDSQGAVKLDVIAMPKPLPERLSFRFSYLDKLGEERERVFHYVFAEKRLAEEGIDT